MRNPGKQSFIKSLKYFGQKLFAITSIKCFVKFKNFLKKLSVTLHALEESADDLGAWSDEDLSLTTFFGVRNALKSVGEGGHADHF